MKCYFRTASDTDIYAGLSQALAYIKWFIVMIMKAFNHVHSHELSHFHQMIRFYQ